VSCSVSCEREKNHMITESRRAEPNRRWLLNGVLALALVGAGIAITFQPTLMSGFARLQNDPGDSRLNNYVLEHHWLWLNGVPLHANLWDPPFFYPKKNVLAYTDTLLSLAPVYCIWRVMGFAPEISFTLWMVTLCLLNYLLALCLLKRAFGVDWPSANFGAYIISFGNSRIAQLSHPQLLSHAYTLLAILSLVMIFRHNPRTQPPISRRRWILAFFVCFAAQFYASYYYGYFLLLVVLIGCIWGVALPRFRQTLKEGVLTDRLVWLSGMLLAAILLTPLAYHYALVAREFGTWRPDTYRAGLPQLASYFWMGGENLLYGWTANLTPLASFSMPNEHQIGLGIVTTLVLLWFLWQERNKDWVLLIGLVAISALFAFTMFPGRIRLWQLWYYALPGIQGIRVMARMGILLLIPAGIALSIFVHSRRVRPKRLLAAIFIALLCCVEQIRAVYSYERELYQRRIDLISAQIRTNCEAIFVSEVTPTGPAWPSQLDGMWASTRQGVPSITGYSGKVPDNWAINNPLIKEPADVQRIEASLYDWCSKNGINRSRVCWIQLQLPHD
jgi:hypothetical protein